MDLKEVEKTFKALGQGMRLKIVSLLAEHEFCVCELEEILNVTQPAISQHLRVLREAGLVEEEKIGQWIFYSLRKERLQHFLLEWSVYLTTPLAAKPELAVELSKVKELEQNPIVNCRPPRRPQ